MSSTLRATNTDIFHMFVIDSGTAISNVVSELAITPMRKLHTLLFVPLVAWTTADIQIELQFEHESSIWRPVYFMGDPLRVEVPVADAICVVPDRFEHLLLIPVNRMRIRSIDPTTFVNVNQGTERKINSYLVNH